MPRPRKTDSEKKQKITITIDKNQYKNLKKRGLKISTYISELLRVANNTGSAMSSENIGFPRTHHFYSKNTSQC